MFAKSRDRGRDVPPEEPLFRLVRRVSRSTLWAFALYGLYATSDHHWLLRHYRPVSGWLLLLLAFWVLVGSAVNARSDSPSFVGRLWIRLAWPPESPKSADYY